MVTEEPDNPQAWIVEFCKTNGGDDDGEVGGRGGNKAKASTPGATSTLIAGTSPATQRATNTDILPKVL